MVVNGGNGALSCAVRPCIIHPYLRLLLLLLPLPAAAAVAAAAGLRQVDEVKGIMLQNVEQVLVRGERLDVLVDRTDDLRDQVRTDAGRIATWQHGGGTARSLSCSGCASVCAIWLRY
jgi:hypothetical protein